MILYFKNGWVDSNNKTWFWKNDILFSLIRSEN